MMAVDFDPGAPPSVVFEKGPPIALARHFASAPAIAPQFRVNRPGESGDFLV